MNYALPLANPTDQRLGADDIVLVRSSEETIRPIDAISAAFSTWRTHFGELVRASIVILTITYGTSFAFGLLQHLVEPDGLVSGLLSAVENVLSFGFGTLLSVTYGLLWLRVLRQQRPDFSPIRDIRQFGVRLLGLSTIGFLASIAYFLTFTFAITLAANFNMFLAIGIGLIVFALTYYLYLGVLFSPLLIVDKNLSVVQAIRASWMLARDRRWEIFATFLFGGIILAVITLLASMVAVLFSIVLPATVQLGAVFIAGGIGALLIHPLGLGIYVSLYNRIAAPGNAYQHEMLTLEEYRF